MRLTAMLVGQAPARAPRSGRPLDGRCGDRLARLAGLGGYEELTSVFAVTNLLPRYPGPKGEKGDGFPRAEARAQAAGLHGILGEEEWDRVVVLGRQAAWALGLDGAPYLRWLEPTTDPSYGRPLTRSEHYGRGWWLVPEWAESLMWPDSRWCVLPHPSGVSRWWNRPENERHAAGFLRALCGELA